MAIIGRLACHWCGFAHAHVKRNDDKLPFHHCPDCGMMTLAKNGLQAKLLQQGMRAVGASADGPQPPATDNPIVVRGVVPVPVPPAPAASPAAPAPTPPRPAGLWDQLMRGL
jgi:hypothetical protein